MASNIKSPNQKGHGFLYLLVAVVVLGVVLVGYITMSHKNKEREATQGSMDNVSMTVQVTDSGITLAAPTPKADVKKVDLYEDFACPHCAELAEQTDGFMKKQIEAGALSVTIHPLNFLDGKVGYSSLAGSATLAVAQQGDAKLYWNYRKTLFEKQRDFYTKSGAKDFANLAEELGANSDTVKSIKDGTNMDEFKKMAEEDAQNLKKVAGAVSSPQVIFDGKVVNTANKDNTAFGDWPAQVVDGTVRFRESEGQ